MIPVALMGSLAIAYVLARPALLGRIPYLAILEFPVGAILVAILLWAALADRERRAPPAPWRKHQQIVRVLPDPALERDLATLARWVEHGEAPEKAADVLARAASTDPDVQARHRAELAQHLVTRRSRRKREHTLNEHIEGA